MKHLVFSIVLFIGVVFSIIYFRINYSFVPLQVNTKVVKVDSRIYEITPSTNEIALIYIGSSSCPYCRSTVLDSTLSTVSNTLLDFTKSKKVNLTKIGLSGDGNLASGLEHLMSLETSFNEVSTGNRWRNATLEKYTNTPFTASLSTPQILITFRTYIDTLGKPGASTISEEELIGRYIGLINIKNIDYKKMFAKLDSEIELGSIK